MRIPTTQSRKDHSRRAKQDASNHFGNDGGLSDLGQAPAEDASRDDDDARLDNKEAERISL